MEDFIVSFPSVIALLFGCLITAFGSVICILLNFLYSSIKALTMAIEKLDLNRQLLDTRVTAMEATCAIRHRRDGMHEREDD